MFFQAFLLLYLVNSAYTSAILKDQSTPFSACEPDITAFCSSKEYTHPLRDIDLIECLQRSAEVANSVSKECHMLIWDIKKNLTKNVDYFNKLSNNVCESDRIKIKECSTLPSDGKSLVLPCMVDHKHKVSNRECFEYLNLVARYIFSDYNLIYNFVDNCQSDIAKFQCGRMQPQQEDIVGSQGVTIECLQLRLTTLTKDCRNEVLKITELQSDDYHLDRPLFYACMNERDQFCGSVKSGEGRVINCLIKHKFDEGFSKNCNTKVTNRQRLAQTDFKINYASYKACENELKLHSCVDYLPGESGVVYTTSAFLLCLEAVQGAYKRKITHVDLGPQCKIAMKDLRRSLMSDYKVTPELVIHCQSTVNEYCADENVDKMHCLMELLRHPPKGERVVPKACEVSLHDFLKLVKVADDVSIDPVLDANCAAMLEGPCRRSVLAQSDSDNVQTQDVFHCLFINRQHRLMTPTCLKDVSHIAYFIMRDITMDDHLLEQCKKDAIELCRVSEADLNSLDNKIARPTLLKCLWAHHPAFVKAHMSVSDKPKVPLSEQCSKPLLEFMHAAANSLDLHPQMAEDCAPDLIQFCRQEIIKVAKEGDQQSESAEMRCLGNNYMRLSTQCKASYERYAQEVEVDVSLGSQLAGKCLEIIDKKCSKIHSKADDDQSLMFECMVQHKYDPDVPAECVHIIEAQEIMQMGSWRFSPALIQECGRDVAKFCQDVQDAGRAEVIECLVRLKVEYLIQVSVMNKTVADGDPRFLTQGCMAQLSTERLRMMDTTKLDPKLIQKCDQDIRDHCSDLDDDEGSILECLRKNSNNLRKPCHELVFARELESALDESIDRRLVTVCNRMAQQYCPKDLHRIDLISAGKHPSTDLQKSSGHLIQCLANQMYSMLTKNGNLDGEKFDEDCAEVIIERLRERLHDYRLDPELARNCQKDIEKHCHVELAQKTGPMEDYHGRVLHCLRKQYGNNQTILEPPCQAHLTQELVLLTMQKDLDPVLADACGEEIMEHCQHEIAQGTRQLLDANQVTSECLKQKMLAGVIKGNSQCTSEVLRLVNEGEADVQLDPILFNACASDLATLCADVRSGEGRKMNCLLLYLDEDETLPVYKRLSTQCRKTVMQRKELWAYAARIHYPETLGEVASFVRESRARNIVFFAILALLLVALIMGCFAGRMSKRVVHELKVR